MTDLRPFTSPIMHYSFLSQSPPPLPSPSPLGHCGRPPHTKVTSPQHLPHPQVTSPHLPHTHVSSSHLPHPQVTSPHLPHTHVSSSHLPHPQVTSPHLPHSQVTSPQNLPHSQVTSPQHLPHPQVTSPQLLPHSQVTSPQHLPHPQVTSRHLPHSHVSSSHLPHSHVSSFHLPHRQVASPHLSHSQVTSPQLSQPQVTSSHLPHPQVTSPHLPHPQVTSPHLSHPQVTSPHLPHPQVTSPHLSHSQVTSPHLPHSQVTSSHLPHSQVTSPHLPHSQVTSPHLPHPQVTSPHLSHSQVTSPHLPHSQVTSPHLPHSQVTSSHLSHSQVTSPHLPHSQVTSPHLPHSQVTSPHHVSPCHLPNKNPDPSFDDPPWSGAGRPSGGPCLLKNSYQTTAHLDLQNQDHFSLGGTHHRDELLYGGVYDPVQDSWGPLGPTLSQLQCSSLGSMPEESPLWRWSSMEFTSSPAEDSSITQFLFQDSCLAPQPFCSPNTPGPSPHHPQTPTISSPGPQVLPSEERLDFQTSRDKIISCCMTEFNSGSLMTSDPSQMSRHLLQSHSGMIWDQTGLLDAARNPESCFSPQGGCQDLNSTTQCPAGGRGGGRNGQPDWTRLKRPQPKNSTEVLDCRLTCTVCKRDFRSLPALNGHMRSHSSSRSAKSKNKVEDSSPLNSPSISMVMPVSVPVQSRATTRAGVQRRCSRLSAAAGPAVLYLSLLHLEEEEETVARDDGGDEVVVEDSDVVGGSHYTPPPMLCPLRVGPGLYCSLTSRRQQRVQTVRLHNTHPGLTDVVAIETAPPLPTPGAPGTNKPRINLGPGFQAEIPPLRGQKHAHLALHNALLLWTPRDELERPLKQQRVEALLTMAHSSVVPGGGASPETTLRVLSECRGDFLLTVEKLLSTPEASNRDHTAQQHPSSSWSAAERKTMVKSLQIHRKDFSRIQKAVQTKSLSQCVEFYYLWKKKMRVTVRTPAGLTVSLPDSHGQRSSKIT